MTKLPKDLGLKMGTKDEVMWTQVAKEAKTLIQQSAQSLKIQNAILLMAEDKIEEEKEKFK